MSIIAFGESLTAGRKHSLDAFLSNFPHCNMDSSCCPHISEDLHLCCRDCPIVLPGVWRIYVCIHKAEFERRQASYDGFALVAHAIILVTFDNGNTCRLTYHI